MSDKLIEKLRAERLPLHEKCQGCDKADDSKGVCSVYYNPSVWWKEKPIATKSVIVNSKTMETKPEPVTAIFCPMASHLEIVEPKLYQKLNPLKASKRKFKGRR